MFGGDSCAWQRTDAFVLRSEGHIAFSDIPEIQSFVERGLCGLAGTGVRVSLKQQIPFGAQLALEGKGGNGLINVYYSKKKGISIVDCSKNDFSRAAIALLEGREPAAVPAGSGRAEHELEAWIGTDESGKGDFFGPLVVAGFFMKRTQEQEILALGVRDSKTLKSADIRSIASILWNSYRQSISVVSPSCRKYNVLYAKFKNLNRLLAWAHARVIENLVAGSDGRAGVEVDGVVADQFGDEAYIRNALKSMKTLNLIQRPKAESNPAVAAASIIARDCFERRLGELRKRFGTAIPFGAGDTVSAAAREFVKKHGREALADAAKTHFKTYREL